jgi:hypothetical protein
MASLNQIDLTSKFGEDAGYMANDLLRVLSIQLAIQIMLVISDPSGTTSFFSPVFISLVIYVTLGVMMYWLALRKLILFV